MPQIRDAGFNGRIISLGGLLGASGLGLFVDRPGASMAFTTRVQVLGNNPSRRWALVQNLGSANVAIKFGDTEDSVATDFILTPGAVLQIDTQVPWTGPIVAEATTGTVTYLEASIQAGR